MDELNHIKSNQIKCFITKYIFPLHSWLDYGWNSTYRLQCVLWKGKIFACTGKSTIPYYTKFARSTWRDRNRGKITKIQYINHINILFIDVSMDDYYCCADGIVKYKVWFNNSQDSHKWFLLIRLNFLLLFFCTHSLKWLIVIKNNASTTKSHR